jgi:hypothetical protein
MANVKVTAMTTLGTASNTHLMYVVTGTTGTGNNQQITFDSLQKSITTVGSTAGIAVPGTVVMASDGYVYFGGVSTDGSFRIGIASGYLVFEKRVGGSWTEKGAM